MFLDYNDQGQYIPGHELPGKSLGQRVDEAMEQQQEILREQVNGTSLHASSSSWNCDGEVLSSPAIEVR